jgi:hypothetical protein
MPAAKEASPTSINDGHQSGRSASWINSAFASSQIAFIAENMVAKLRKNPSPPP